MPDNMIHNIPVEMLSEHQKASELIPEMTKEEFDDFLKSVKDEGVKVPIDITRDKKVLDGRHRLRAANLLGIEKLPAIYHDFSDEEAIKFVCDTATKRRSLTPAQKYDVISKTKSIIENLREEGRKRISENNKTRNSTFPDREKREEKEPYDSNKEIAKLTGMSNEFRSSTKRRRRSGSI